MTDEQDDFWYKLLPWQQDGIDAPGVINKNAYIWNGLMYEALKNIAEKSGEKFDKELFAEKPFAKENELREFFSFPINPKRYESILTQIIEKIENENSFNFSIQNIAGRKKVLNFSYCIFPLHFEILVTNINRPDVIIFNNCIFQKGIIFTNYNSNAFFRNSEFYESAKFLGGFSTTDFNESSFECSPQFDKVNFKQFTQFEKVNFSEYTYFSNTTFNSGVSFSSAIFSNGGEFDGATFEYSANFNETKFHGIINFNNTTWKSGCNFSGTKFTQSPPKFYGANIHPNILFTNIKLPNSKWIGVLWETLTDPLKTLFNYNRHKENLSSHEKIYEHLSSQMQILGRESDRHFFYRHQMRAQERCFKTGWLISSLYGRFFGYGYGLWRAIFWWAVNIIVGWWCIRSTVKTIDKDSIAHPFYDLLAQSFSNAHPFLFLRRGWVDTENKQLLLTSGEKLNNLSPETMVSLNLIAGLQSIFGVILLYFVLLMLRNRFKM